MPGTRQVLLRWQLLLCFPPPTPRLHSQSQQGLAPRAVSPGSVGVRLWRPFPECVHGGGGVSPGPLPWGEVPSQPVAPRAEGLALTMAMMDCGACLRQDTRNSFARDQLKPSLI